MKQNALESILSFFNVKGKHKLLTCPVDYTVSVTSGSINAFGNSVSLPISGTGTYSTKNE